MENADEFLDVMQTYDESLIDLDDALAYAIAHSEEIGDTKWMGHFGGGVFYADCDGSHWFADMTSYEAKIALAQKYLEDLEG